MISFCSDPLTSEEGPLLGDFRSLSTGEAAGGHGAGAGGSGSEDTKRRKEQPEDEIFASGK